MTIARRDLFPSGPISTAACVPVCAGMRNANYLELQNSKVDWRSDVLILAERFTSGTIEIPDRPGFGEALNEDVIRARALPL
jgi:galactonate dehydratase